MTEQAVVEVESAETVLPASLGHRRRLWLFGAALTAVFIVVIVLLTQFFPYSEKNVSKNLLETFPGQLHIDHFRAVYFPWPGCIASGVTFHPAGGSSDSPLTIKAQSFRIRGHYAELLLRPHYIARIDLEGLRVQVPVLQHGTGSPGSSAMHTQDSKITVGQIVADGSVLEVARSGGKQPDEFVIHQLRLESVSAKGGMSYWVRMRNPEPPGEIVSGGHLGPITEGDVGKTPVSGGYSFQQVDLGALAGIAGTLTSDGKFSGGLARIEFRGQADVPDFEVVRSKHRGRLVTQFEGSVNGLNGDLALANVSASYLGTQFRAAGTVAHHDGWQGKFTSLDVAVHEGRMQDLLWLFVRKDPPPMAGQISFQTHLEVPPEGRPFLRELRLGGDFDIEDGRFEAQSRQASVNRLSETARGEKKAQQDTAQDASDNVNAQLRGHVELRSGEANFADASFVVPGAEAHVHGTYNLLSEKVDLHGTLRMEVKFSQGTSGIKALVAKLLDPIFDKKHGSVVPVVMNGTYAHPHFGLELDPIPK